MPARPLARICPTPGASGWGRGIALLGPAFAVGIGYIDPGNWATDLSAGAYGCELLWVVVVAGIIAMVLQLACARLAIVSGDDLATAICKRWKRAAPWLGLTVEAAVMATDLAEFAGIVVGLELLFHLSVIPAAFIAVLSVSAIFIANRGSVGWLQRTLIAMLGLVAILVAYQLVDIHTPLSAIAAGSLIPHLGSHGALLVTVGIIGATVMPHNFFLHSALIKENCADCSPDRRRTRWRFYALETIAALAIATLINGAILIVGANIHGAANSFAQAFALLRSNAGELSAVLFGVGLCISGLASASSATLTNDYVVSAFSPVRLPPLWRRAIAALPATVAMICAVDPIRLMLWSQVVLAVLLPAVVIPLLILSLSRRSGFVRCPRPLIGAALAAVAVCLAFDGALIFLTIAA
jgi:manganese transport protein